MINLFTRLNDCEEEAVRKFSGIVKGNIFVNSEPLGLEIDLIHPDREGTIMVIVDSCLELLSYVASEPPTGETHVSVAMNISREIISTQSIESLKLSYPNAVYNGPLKVREATLILKDDRKITLRPYGNDSYIYDKKPYIEKDFDEVISYLHRCIQNNQQVTN
ncbi:hypothetical protein H4O14_02005 [Bacillus sp. PAMC26568]|nr:hypothetical protein H4O14_02005 [Bacillus sp. PAMC26568]